MSGCVQQRRRQVAAHPLAEAQLTHRHVEQWLEIQQRHQLFARANEADAIDAIDVAQQVERLCHRQVPPELGALTEHDADARDMGDAIAPRHQSVDGTTTARAG